MYTQFFLLVGTGVLDGPKSMAYEERHGGASHACHPEALPKDLAPKEDSLSWQDPSLAFRMTTKGEDGP